MWLLKMKLSQKSLQEYCKTYLKRHTKLFISNFYRSGNSSQASNQQFFDAMRNISNLPHKNNLCTWVTLISSNISWVNLSTQSENSLEFKFIEWTFERFLMAHVSMVTRGRGSAGPSNLDLVLTTQLKQPDQTLVRLTPINSYHFWSENSGNIVGIHWQFHLDSHNKHKPAVLSVKFKRGNHI